MKTDLGHLTFVVAASLLAFGCGSDDTDSDPAPGGNNNQPGVCDGVSCSAHEHCISDGGTPEGPTCVCDTGYHLEGTDCVADGGGGGFAGSCTANDGSFCIDYTGTAWASSTIEQACGTTSTYSSAHCTTNQAVGTCSTESAPDMETVTYYYAPLTASSLESSCTAANGVWVTL